MKIIRAIIGFFICCAMLSFDYQNWYIDSTTVPNFYNKVDTIPNTLPPVSNPQTIYQIWNLRIINSLLPPIKDTLNHPALPYPGAMTIRPQDVTLGTPIVYMTNGLRWAPLIANTQDGTDSLFADSLFVTDDLYITTEGGRQVLHRRRSEAIVTTVAGLRAMAVPYSDILYETLDYGGGLWNWDATSVLDDNLGTIIKSAAEDTGRFIRQFQSPINCLWFGISGDTTVDNSQSFIDMFASVGEGHSFYLPGGLFKISNETMGDIIIPSNTYFFGAGRGSTTIKLFDSVSAGTSATVNMFLTADGGTNITVEHMTIDGNRQNQSWLPVGSANYGLGVRSSNTTIVNVEIKNVTANGTGMSADNGAMNVTFDKIWSHDNGKKGFHSGLVANIKIINSRFSNNEEDAGIGIHAGMKEGLIDNNSCDSNRTGIQIGNSTGRPLSYNFTISNNKTKDNEENGLSIGGSNNVSTVDSLKRNCQVTGNTFINDIVQFTGANEVNFDNNTLTNSFIKIQTAFNLDIKNNKIKLDSNTNVAAIHIVGGAFSASTFTVGDKINVSNNTITIAPEIDYGISSALTSNLTVRDNVIIGTADIFNVRVWDNVGTASIRQIGSGSVRIDGQTFATGYDNSGLTVSAADLDHGKIGNTYFLTPSNQLKVCSVASTYDGNGDLVTPATWVIPVLDASETSKGLSERATQAEVEAGVDNERYITPFRFENFNDGIVGGKTLTGGEDAGEDLTLRSTNDATPGYIKFGNAGNSWYDEDNNIFGIGVGISGTPVTTEKLTITNSLTGSLRTGIRLENRFSAVNTGVRLAFGAASSQTVTGAIDNIQDASSTERHLDFSAYNGSALGIRARLTGIGNFLLGTTTNNASAMIQMSSAVAGLAVPTMTTTQKNAIASPLERIIVYDNVFKKHFFYNGSEWGQFVDIITSGAAATAGTATLVSGTVTVSTTAVAAGSIIEFSYQNCSTCATLYKGSITAGTSFIINSTNGADGSIVSWRIIY